MELHERGRNRPDILRIKRKILEEYPVNSVARKNLLREERVRDLKMVSSKIPDEIVAVAFTLGEQALHRETKRAMLASLALLGSGLLLTLVSTPVEAILVGVLIGVSFYFVIKHGYSWLKSFLALRLLMKQYKKMQDTIKELKKNL